MAVVEESSVSGSLLSNPSRSGPPLLPRSGFSPHRPAHPHLRTHPPAGSPASAPARAPGDSGLGECLALLGCWSWPAWAGRWLPVAAAARAGAAGPTGRARGDARGLGAALLRRAEQAGRGGSRELRGAGEGQRATMGSRPSTLVTQPHGFVRRGRSQDARQVRSGIRNDAAQRGRQGAVGPSLPSRVAPHWARPASALSALRRRTAGYLGPCFLPGTHPSQAPGAC